MSSFREKAWNIIKSHLASDCDKEEEDIMNLIEQAHIEEVDRIIGETNLEWGALNKMRYQDLKSPREYYEAYNKRGKDILSKLQAKGKGGSND